MMLKKHAILLTVAMLGFSPGVCLAADCTSLRGDQGDSKLSDYLDGYRDCVAARQAQEMTRDALDAKPAATAGAAGFGSQLRDTIEDFRPLLSFALDSVSTSDDDKSAVVRFNPLRAGSWGSMGFTLTITEPEPGEELLKEVDESDRARLKELAANDLDDFSNLTLGVTWGIEFESRGDSRWLLGRNYKRYKPFIEGRLIPAVAHAANIPQQAENEAISQKIERCNERLDVVLGVDPDEAVDAQDFTLDKLESLWNVDFDECLAAFEADEERVVEFIDLTQPLRLVPNLIDNQPQLVFSAAWNERDRLVGRNGWEAKLSYEHGRHNFNTLLGKYQDLRKTRGLTADPENETDPDRKARDQQALSDAFLDSVESLDDDKVEAENKFTFSALYRERDAYTVDRTFGTGDDALAVAIDLDSATEYCIKAEWHRNATWQPMTIDGETVHPRFHFSLEGVDVEDDPNRQDRIVAVITYEMPLPGGSTLPLSLTYANRSEFLGEQDHELSAHFGISYKLPEKIGSKD